MADNDIRIPKGILKNKYGSSSSRESVDITSQIGIGSKYGRSSWESTLGMIGTNPLPVVAPVPAPQHGMNMPNPILDPVMRGIKSDFSSPVSRKLHEFISNKHNLLFRPLDADEMPMSEVKGVQQNTEDHYGIVPSFDHFLRVDKSEVLRYFYQNAQIGDIVVAKVLSRSSSGLYLLLLCCEGGKHMILEELNVRAFCPAYNMISVDPRDPTRHFDIDDYVRVEVVDFDKNAQKINVGMKGETLSQEMQHSFQLGIVSSKELPRYYLLSKSKNSNDPRVRKTYQDILHESPGFQNPNSVSHLASNMGLYRNSNTLMTGLRSGFPVHEKASQIRRIQNAKWAHGHVADGIKYFKMAKYTEAFQSLNNALNIDAENVEALVARGALYANNGNYEKAIDDFESALKFNPNHFNARKYLAETLVGLGRQQEENGKLEDAIASYSKSLVVKPDNNDAKEALWSLHTRTEKLDISKLVGPAAAKAAELKSKLKTILQSELGMKVEAKLTKDKKSKKDKKKKDSSASDDDSSSSSSSDESSSDSSSSESGHKKRSKKRKKKKSKKAKKSRKDTGSDRKHREVSLSPFSKRLTEPSSGLPIGGTGFSGLMDSTYAELQLGISRPEKNDSDDDDTKRSSKKSKDKKRSKKSKDKKKKKRRASSDSSSSGSDSERTKKKSKKPAEETPLQGLLPDLGDLEAKLSAYYSKVEQGKLDSNTSSRRSFSRSRSRSWGQSKDRRRSPSPARRRSSYGRDRGRSRSRTRSQSPTSKHSLSRDRNHGRSSSRTHSPLVSKHGRDNRDYADIPPRVIENVPPMRIEENLKPWSERKPGKIDLQTDDYGNMVQAQQIVCTVKNDIPPPEPPKLSRFEMKFKPMSDSGVASKGENGSKPISSASDPISKWRPLGAAVPPSEAVKSAFGIDRDSPPRRTNDKRESVSPTKEDKKGYRRRSRSRSSSRSPIRSRKRSRSYSRSRSRSRSKRSYTSSRSRSRSPYKRDRRSRYDGGGGFRGRAPVRFFRGYNYSRGGGSRRPYGGRSFLDRDYGGGAGGGGRSRFRNRFSRTPSRSRSRSHNRRSKSRSYSPRERRGRSRSRSKDRVKRVDIGPVDSKPHNQSQESNSSKMEADSVSQSQEDKSNEIQLGSLKASSAEDLEVLLDKRNAERKEEMRKSNPDFFRAT